MEELNIETKGPVLLVDDDDTFRADFSAFLESKSITVISMPSAVHACKFMQGQPWTWFPSLIITDIVMNGMGGYEFIRRVEDMYPNRKIPAVVISKLQSGIDIMEAQSAGAWAYLAKPMTNSAMLKAIKKAINGKQREMQIFSKKSMV